MKYPVENYPTNIYRGSDGICECNHQENPQLQKQRKLHSRMANALATSESHEKTRRHPQQTTTEKERMQKISAPPPDPDDLYENHSAITNSRKTANQSLKNSVRQLRSNTSTPTDSIHQANQPPYGTHKYPTPPQVRKRPTIDTPSTRRTRIKKQTTSKHNQERPTPDTTGRQYRNRSHARGFISKGTDAPTTLHSRGHKKDEPGRTGKPLQKPAARPPPLPGATDAPKKKPGNTETKATHARRSEPPARQSPSKRLIRHKELTARRRHKDQSKRITTVAKTDATPTASRYEQGTGKDPPGTNAGQTPVGPDVEREIEEFGEMTAKNSRKGTNRQKRLRAWTHRTLARTRRKRRESRTGETRTETSGVPDEHARGQKTKCDQ